MKENARFSKCRNFKLSGSFSSGQPRETWNGARRSNLKERKINKDIFNGRNASNSFIRNRPINESLKNKYEKIEYDAEIELTHPNFSQNKPSDIFH